MRLNEAQIAFFKDQGYLILRGLLPAELCEKAAQRVWQTSPPSIQRNDPNTWQRIRKEEESDSALLIKQGYKWQDRESGTEKVMIDLIEHPGIKQVAEQLLGDDLIPPKLRGKPMGTGGAAWPGGPTDPAADGNNGIRGVYVTLPQTEPPLPDSLHTDGHPMMLGAVGLLHDVPHGGGGFKYDTLRVPYYEQLPSLHRDGGERTERGQPQGGIYQTSAYIREREDVMKDTAPVEGFGKRGLGHMAGYNTVAGSMRMAVLFDYNNSKLDGARGDPPQQDMWRDWSREVRSCEAHYSAEFAATQRLSLSESGPALEVTGAKSRL